MSEHYFTFPLSVLNGPKAAKKTTPLECLSAALSVGILNAGIGYQKTHGNDGFRDKLQEVCDELELEDCARPEPDKYYANILVGSSICGVMLRGDMTATLKRELQTAQSIPTGGPLVRMKSKFLWAALNQAKAEYGAEPYPDHGISWREFRILCAILSAQTNRAGFAFVGWETIQYRSCGFTNKKAYKDAEKIPDHLAPPLSRKIIRTICNSLEDLGFYARFHFSSGKSGGLMAYSVRHSRDELAKAVCDSVNFRDRAKIKANREDDAKKCLELLERAKVGPRWGQQ